MIDCDLSNTSAQDNLATGGDSCGSLGGNDLNFGSANPNSTIVNPAILEGWGVRPSDWQFGVSVQQELLPRVAVNVGYNRRWFQNFFVTDNTLTTAADYSQWSLVLPQNPLLPGAGSTANYYNITPAASARGAQNYQTFETDFAPARTTVLAWLRRQPERAAARPQSVRRHDHRSRRARHLRALRGAARAAPGGHHQPAHRFVRGHRAVDDDGQGAGRVHDPEDRRRGERERAVRAECRSAPDRPPPRTGHRGTRTPRCPTPSSSRRSAACRPMAWRTARPRSTCSTRRSCTATRITQVDMRFAKIVRFSRFRAEVGADLLNLFNTEPRHRLHRDVRLEDRRRDLAAAQRDRRAAVRAVQSQDRLLINRWRLGSGDLGLGNRGWGLGAGRLSS